MKIINACKWASGVELRKAHKAHSPAQPNPQMGWALGPTVVALLYNIYLIETLILNLFATSTDWILFKFRIYTYVATIILDSKFEYYIPSGRL